MLEWFLLSAKLLFSPSYCLTHKSYAKHTCQVQISSKSSCLEKKGTSKEESVENGREMRSRERDRERRSRRRAVQRFLWEFVSHLSDRPLVSILATLSDRHCQVIIRQALHLAHTQMEAVYARA